MLAAALLLAFPLAACHKEAQAVEGVAKTAEKAEHQAQATATERDQERAQLEQIPLPTKSLYVDIHDPSAWQNPFLSVGADTVALRIILPDENPSAVGQGTLLRPAAARRQESNSASPSSTKLLSPSRPAPGRMAVSSPWPSPLPPRPVPAPRCAATWSPSSAASTISASSSKSGHRADRFMRGEARH